MFQTVIMILFLSVCALCILWLCWLVPMHLVHMPYLHYTILPLHYIPFTSGYFNYSSIHFIWFIYLKERKKEKVSKWLSPQMPAAGGDGQGWDWELGTPSAHGWREPSYLSPHCWLPGSALAKSWTQQPKPGLKPRYSMWVVGSWPLGKMSTPYLICSY